MDRGALDHRKLARSQLLGRLAHDDLRNLLTCAVQRSFATGQVVFQRGDAGDGMYILASGDVRIVIESAQGREVTVAVLGEGDVLGELSILDGSPRSASAIAHTPVEALYVAADHFQSWLMQRPAAAVLMLAELARRVRGADHQMAEVALVNLETRIARRIWHRFVECSPDRSPQSGMTIRVNQTALAADLGVTRESVNKHLARLREPGVITVHANDVTLMDPGRLMDMAALGE